MSMSERPAERLRAKTPPPSRPQMPLVGLGVRVDEPEADPRRGRLAYLVLLPHPKQQTTVDGWPMMTPISFSKKDILGMFLESCKRPIYRDARNIAAQPSVALKRTGVWREAHQEDAVGEVHMHDHLPVLAIREFMYLPVKRALL